MRLGLVSLALRTSEKSACTIPVFTIQSGNIAIPKHPLDIVGENIPKKRGRPRKIQGGDTHDGDKSIISALQRNADLSFTSHIERLRAKWDPLINRRYVVQFGTSYGDRHCGTSGSNKLITEFAGLEKIAINYAGDFLFSDFQLQCGGVERTLSRKDDLAPILLSILIENENVDFQAVHKDENDYEHVTDTLMTSTSFFDFRISAHYESMEVNRM